MAESHPSSIIVGETLKSEIFYFTGTGNSLLVAKSRSKKINGKIISISSIMREDKINSCADIIGIVFPVYYSDFKGIPLIIERFIEKIGNFNSKYIFVVCTHKGRPGSTIENLRKSLKKRNIDLAAGFSVKLSIPYSTSMKIRKALFKKDLPLNFSNNEKKELKKLLSKWDKKLDSISEIVINKKFGIFETTGNFRKIIGYPLRSYMQFMHKVRLRELTGEKKSFFKAIYQFC